MPLTEKDFTTKVLVKSIDNLNKINIKYSFKNQPRDWPILAVLRLEMAESHQTGSKALGNEFKSQPDHSSVHKVRIDLEYNSSKRKSGILLFVNVDRLTENVD